MRKPVPVVLFLAFLSLAGSIGPEPSRARTETVKPAPDGEIPLLAWHSIPDNETTVGRYRELKEAGFNISSSSHANADGVQKALDCAQQAGVRVIFSCPELAENPEATVRRFMNHPALAGYYLRDEPSAGDFPALGAWARRIRAVDDKHMCYLNLFPTYASNEQLGSPGYREHIRQFVKEVPSEMLSFDHYPVTAGKSGLSLREDFYRNLEIFSDEAGKAGKPFWAFALAVAHDPYPVPDLAQLRLQMFSNLAYGAQGLQYFTYWTPGKNPHWNFHHGPIGLDGKRTDVYDKVKELNREISALAPVFLGGRVLQVRHIGEVIPESTTRLSALPSKVSRLDVKGLNDKPALAGAVVSEIRNGDRRYLVVVNRDFQKRMRLDISLDPAARRVLKDGSLVMASLYSDVQLVEPGDMLIFRLD